MPGAPNDPLREMLRRELETFAAAGDVSAERLSAIASLAKAIEIRDSLQPKPRDWWPALVLAGTLIIVSVLLFARVGETDIELDASVQQFGFSLARQQALTGPMELSALGVSGIGDVHLPQPHGDSAVYAGPAISLTSSTSGNRRGTITLSPVLLPVARTLTFGQTGVASQYRLSTDAAGLTLEAAVNGPMTFGAPGVRARELDFRSPEPVSLKGAADELDLDLTFPALPRFPFSPQLGVRDVSLSRVDQFRGPDGTLVRHVSTILAGTLSLESLNGEEHRLRAGEELRFAKSAGEIRTVELADNHIGLKFHGRVAGMTTGAGEGYRSLMPTYLEWLRARHGLSLLWGTSLYLFGIIAAGLRWWGVRI